MAKLCLYTRRSTERQVASPATQERECRDWADAQGHEIVRVWHEVPISGKTEIERRTALPQLLSEVRAGNRDFDAIVVWKIDRLARNPAEYHRILAILDKHKCALLSVKDHAVKRDTATDRLMSNVLADFAAYEREIIGERIFVHHRTAFLSGKWPGSAVPMGLKWLKEEKRFVAGDRAADVITLFRTYVETNGNAAATSRLLNLSGLRSPKGNLWSSTVALGTLRSPMYRRRLAYDGNEIDALEVLPQIVPEELVCAVDALLEYSPRLTPRQKGSKHVYSGLVKCSKCGSILIGSTGYTDAGKPYVRWVCKATKFYRICESHQVTDKNLDTLVGVAMTRLLRTLQSQFVCSKETTLESHVSDVAQQRRKLEAARKRIIDTFIAGIIDQSELQSRVADIDLQLLAIRPETRSRQLDMAEIAGLIEKLCDQWNEVPDSEKRGLLMHLKVEIVADTSGQQPFWIELHCQYTPDPIRAEGYSRGRWPIRVYE